MSQKAEENLVLKIVASIYFCTTELDTYFSLEMVV